MGKDILLFEDRQPYPHPHHNYTHTHSLLVLASMEEHCFSLTIFHAHLLSLETSSRKANSHLRAHQLGHLFIPVTAPAPPKQPRPSRLIAVSLLLYVLTHLRLS